MKNNILHLNDRFISMKELTLLFHKQSSFMHILEEYISKNALNESVSLLMPNGEQKQVLVFHYGIKEGNKFGLYLYKKALPAFLKNNLENIIQLGVQRERLYALLKIIPTLSVEEKESQKENLLLISKLATRYTNNPRAATLLAQYIKDTFLAETYQPNNLKANEKQEKNMFCFSPSFRGKSAVYLLKEALPHFEKKHQIQLIKKAKEFEKDGEFLSLRGLANFLGNNAVEKELLQLILKNKDETFEIKNQNGETEQIKTFHLKKHGDYFYLNVNKKGIHQFVINHQKTLVKMGFNMAQIIPQVFDKNQFHNDYITCRTLANNLCDTPKKRDDFFHFMQSVFQTEQTDPLLLNYRDTLFIKKENIPAFLLKHKELFLKNGAHLKHLEDLTGEQSIIKRNEQMIPFKKFSAKLKSDYFRYKKLLPLIKQNLLTETYSPKTNPNKKLPCFVQCKSQRRFIYCFQNEEAAASFLKNHKNELIEIGYKKEMIEHLSGEATYPFITNDFLYLNEMKKALHTNNPLFNEYIFKNCLNDTYTEIQADGTPVTKPMFSFLQGKKLRFGDYAISKKALKAFITKYGADLNIKKSVQDSILLDKPIEEKKETFVTLTFLSELLGMSSKRVKMLYELVKNRFIDESVLVKNNGKISEKKVFHFAYTKSGRCTLYMESACLPAFLIKNKDTFLKFGIKEEKLNQIAQFSKEPSLLAQKIATHSSRVNTYLKRKQNQSKTKEN